MSKIFENLTTKIVFWAMSKGITYLYAKDEEVMEYFRCVKDKTTISVGELGFDNFLTFEKQQDKLYTYKNNEKPDKVDLEIIFKFSSSLFNILFGKISVRTAYANKAFSLRGEIRDAMAFVFAVEKFMAYFMPKKVYRNIYKREPNMAVSRFKMIAHILFGRRSRK